MERHFKFEDNQVAYLIDRCDFDYNSNHVRVIIVVQRVTRIFFKKRLAESRES